MPSFLKFNYPEAINGFNEALITDRIEKIKKISRVPFKSLGESFLKFNDYEEISKQLTVLIKC